MRPHRTEKTARIGKRLRVLCWLAATLFWAAAAQAGQTTDAGGGTWLPQSDMEWGGHLRAIGTGSFPDDGTLYSSVGSSPYYDGQLEVRLKSRLYLGTRITMEAHYELVALGGDTREGNAALQKMPSSSLSQYLGSFQAIDDDRRLFDLTQDLAEQDRHRVYHRLDRLHLTYTPDWGTLGLGRQALTWGNGMVFNPMDLFNPFSPTAVQRDYKAGDDMAHLQLPLGSAGLQFLYLPRRDPKSGDLQDDRSSFAAKYHTPAGPLELDAMAARHYGEAVFGGGVSGYMGGAAWRVDSTFTDASQQEDFLQIVANVDYAWIWGGKNVYGLAEFHYNGLGKSGGYDRAITDTALMERVSRGELHTIGRYYLAGRLQIELHPLVQLHATAIVNLSDPSGVLQPQLLWDVTGDVRFIAGGRWYRGGGGSEYGGWDAATGDGAFSTAPAGRIYFRLTHHF